MIAMGVCDENVRHRLITHRVEQRFDVGRIVRTGIDDGNLARPMM